jgi:hypothetical protein
MLSSKLDYEWAFLTRHLSPPWSVPGIVVRLIRTHFSRPSNEAHRVRDFHSNVNESTPNKL